jgi:hypothetical protein
MQSPVARRHGHAGCVRHKPSAVTVETTGTRPLTPYVGVTAPSLVRHVVRPMKVHAPMSASVPNGLRHVSTLVPSSWKVLEPPITLGNRVADIQRRCRCTATGSSEYYLGFGASQLRGEVVQLRHRIGDGAGIFKSDGPDEGVSNALISNSVRFTTFIVAELGDSLMDCVRPVLTASSRPWPSQCHGPACFETQAALCAVQGLEKRFRTRATIYLRDDRGVPNSTHLRIIGAPRD